MLEDYSYIGVGKVSMRVAGSAAPLRPVGNASALSFAVSEEEKKLKNYMQAGGGTRNSVRRVDGVQVQMTWHDLSPENLAIALFGEVDAVVAASVSGEDLTLYKGGLATTAYVIDTTQTVTLASVEGSAASTRANTTAVSLNAYLVPAVANGYYYKVTTAGTTAGSPPTFPTTVGATVTDGTAVLTCMGKISLTVDTEFTVSGAGVYIEEDAPVTDGQIYDAGYTKAASYVVQALLNAAQEYEMVFDGLNEARSGKPVVVHAFRVKIGAAANLGLIGEDYAGLEVAGEVLADTSKNGTTVSQYFNAKVVS